MRPYRALARAAAPGRSRRQRPTSGVLPPAISARIGAAAAAGSGADLAASSAAGDASQLAALHAASEPARALAPLADDGTLELELKPYGVVHVEIAPSAA